MAAVRELIALECSDCKRRNYTTTKNKKKQSDKLTLKKYCRFDRKHTEHKETKVKLSPPRCREDAGATGLRARASGEAEECCEWSR